VVTAAAAREPYMKEQLTATHAASELSAQVGVMIRPRDISDLLYKRILDVNRCPIVGDRRMIPRDYLPTVLDVLRTRKLIASKETQT
jgi:hypothetical protein